ncbi:MAG: hypothetical protein ACI92Z_002254 [Paracoccaceae bacterium]|jgi:hypothetical protein
MSKQPIPLSTPDISQFTRILGRQIHHHDGPLSHLSLMNMLARAGSFQNYQHMRAAQARLDLKFAEVTTDFRLVERTLNQFDEGRNLIRWPSRRWVQELCLWAL